MTVAPSRFLLLNNVVEVGMAESKRYSKIPLGAIRALSGQDGADFAVYLQHQNARSPVLYRAAGAELSTPDFARLTEYGLSCFHVKSDDLRRCEDILETRLKEVLQRGEGTPAERTQLVVHVGTTVARDLSGGPEPGRGLSRATQLLESVMCGVLSDPHVAANMLTMTQHEAGVASHLFIVSMLSIAFGQAVLGGGDSELKELGLAGMMHDIGKLGITAELLNKEGKLEPEEHMLIQQHPIESVRLLHDDPAATDNVRRMILEHHERVDGQGYPLGLIKEDLSAGGRVLAIVDTFHALIGRRSYRSSITMLEAVQVIRRQAEHQFDGELVRCFADFIERVHRTQQMESLVTTVQGGELVATRHEHRITAPRRNSYGNRAKRFLCHTKRHVCLVYAGRLCGNEDLPREFTVDLRDASRSGMCVFSQRPMYRGEMLNVHVEGADKTAWVRGVVAWCRRDEEDRFRVGIQFLRRISNEEVYRRVPVRTMVELEVALLGGCSGNVKERKEVETRMAGTQADVPDDLDGVLDAAMKAKKVPRELEAQVIDIASTGDAGSRAEAISVLAKIGTRASRAALVAMLQDEDPEVRSKAIETVGLLEMHEATGKLLRILKSSDEGCVLRAASALARLGDKSAVPVVVGVVEGDGPNTRLAARILGTMIGQRFAANAEGVRAARRYIEASSLKHAV